MLLFPPAQACLGVASAPLLLPLQTCCPLLLPVCHPPILPCAPRQVGDTFVLNCLEETNFGPLMKHFLKRFPPGGQCREAQQRGLNRGTTRAPRRLEARPSEHHYYLSSQHWAHPGLPPLKSVQGRPPPVLTVALPPCERCACH